MQQSFQLDVKLKLTFHQQSRFFVLRQHCRLLRWTNRQCQAFHLLNFPTLGGMKSFLRQRNQESVRGDNFSLSSHEICSNLFNSSPVDCGWQSTPNYLRKLFVKEICDRKLQKLCVKLRGIDFQTLHEMLKVLKAQIFQLKAELSRQRICLQLFAIFAWMKMRWDEKNFLTLQAIEKNFSLRNFSPTKHRRERRKEKLFAALKLSSHSTRI